MSVNYREPQWLLPNEKNLQYPAAGATQGSGLTVDRHSLYSMDFDGSNQLIDLGTDDTLEITSDFSISVWIKDSSSLNRGIICCGDRNNGSGWHVYRDSNNKVAFNLYTVNSRTATGTTSINTGEWFHIVATFEKNGTANEQIKIYINTVKEGQNGWISAQTPTYTGTIYKQIAYPYAGLNEFLGNIDEVAIFSRVLSSDEINSLYNSGSPSNPMLLSGKPDVYYPLGEQARNPNGTSDWRFPNEVLQGQVIDFDGSTDYIDVDTINLGTTFTLSCWVNFDSFAATKNVIFGETNNRYAMYFPDSTSVDFNFGSYVPFTVSAISSGVWYNIVLTRNGANGELFINGQSKGTKTSFGSSDFNLNFIGCENQVSGTNYNLDGRLSNVAIWNSDQSANIANIYNYGAPQTSYTVTPTAWYKLDKTSTFTGLNPNWHSALSFNGSTNYIDLGSSNFGITATTAFSISAWINSPISGTKDILSKRETSGGYTGFTFRLDHSASKAGKVTIILDGTGGQAIATTNTDLNPNVWYHVAVTSDGTGNGSGLKIYINGVDDTTGQSGTVTDISNSINTMIGSSAGLVSFFNGKISNTAIFNQTISAEDVKYLYNGGTPQTNISFEPLSWYKLDNTGTGILDSGSASNNGTNNGATEVASNVAVDQWNFDNAAQSQTPNWSSALEFNRSGINYLKINGPALNFTDKMSFSGWVKFTSIAQDVYTVASNFDPNSGYKFAIYYYRDNNPSSSFFRVRINSTNNTLQTYTVNGQLDVDRWYHLAFSFDGTTNANGVNLYIDNVKHSFTASYSGIYPNTTNGTRIGNYQDNNTWAMIGEISNVAFWDINLSTNQINDLYNNGQPETTISHSPLSYYKLDNITTGIQDSGSASNNANITGTIPEIQTNVWTPRLNAESDTLPSTALVSSDLQFNSAYSSFSLDFDQGSSDYINCGGVTELQNASVITWNCWVNFDIANFNIVFGKHLTTTNDAIQFYTWASGVGYFWLKTAGTSVTATINSFIGSLVNLNEWNMFSIVFDGTQTGNDRLKIYLNGGSTNIITSYSATPPATLPNTTDDFYIGRGANGYFDGKIDEFSIFNKSLNQAERTSIYNNGYPKDITALAPVSWWRLGEDAYYNGTDFIIPNQIIGAPNGTSNGMPATALVADAPGSYAAGLGSSLVLADRVGDAPLSTANSVSFNMTPVNRISYPAGYVPTQVDNVYSMAFDGTNYVSAANTFLNSATVCSISFWGKKSASNKQLAVGGFIDGSNGIWIQWYSDGNIYFSPRGSGAGSFTVSYAQSYDTNWHHYVGVYDGSNAANCKLYLDGNLVATGTGTPPAYLPSTTGDNFQIGALGTSFYTTGSIDEVAIFDYALSERQIKQDIYNGTTSGKTADLNNISNLTAPVAWYRMGD